MQVMHLKYTEFYHILEGHSLRFGQTLDVGGGRGLVGTKTEIIPKISDHSLNNMCHYMHFNHLQYDLFIQG